MPKEMATITPLAYKQRRHSAMYENILIRQICELNPATDEPIAKNLEVNTNPKVRKKSSLTLPSPSKSKLSAETNKSHLVICTKDELEAVGDKIALEFNNFMKLESSRFFYFSELSGFQQTQSIESLSSLLETKNYWLNIKEPTMEDLVMLQRIYGIHDLTIVEILERNTAEKIEVFQDYTFISIHLMLENIGIEADAPTNVDMDFNIILFRDFIITVHYKEWSNMCVMLGFLNLLSANTTQSVLIQDWVLFSCFIELRQDAQKMVGITKAQINQVRIEYESHDSELDTTGIMERNFEMELHIYAISRYIKPKMKILKEFRKPFWANRLNVNTRLLCSDLYDDFQDLNNDLSHFFHILERSQENFLGILLERDGREGNELNIAMKWISQAAVLFLPKNTLTMLMGMNVFIPLHFSVFPSQFPFFTILGVGLIVGLVALRWMSSSSSFSVSKNTK